MDDLHVHYTSRLNIAPLLFLLLHILYSVVMVTLQRRAEQLEATIAAKERYCESLRSTLVDLQKMANTRERADPSSLNDVTTQTDANGLNPFIPVILPSGVQPLSIESRSLASSPGPSEVVFDGVVGVSSAMDVVVRTRPMSASSIGMGGGGGGSAISTSSLDANLQLELKKAGFDVSDPYEAIDTLGQSTVSLTTSDLDRKLGVANLNDTLESVEGSVRSVGSEQLPPSSPNMGSGLGRRHSMGEEDEDLFHSVVERVEPVTVEIGGVVGGVQQLTVTDCEDDNLTGEPVVGWGGGGKIFVDRCAL